MTFILFIFLYEIVCAFMLNLTLFYFVFYLLCAALWSTVLFLTCSTNEIGLDKI